MEASTRGAAWRACRLASWDVRGWCPGGLWAHRRGPGWRL